MKHFALLLFHFSLIVTSLHASSATSKRIQISENAEPGYVVANAAELLHLRSKSGNFKLLRPNSPSTYSPPLNTPRIQWFELDKSTGKLTLRHRVDREALCEESTTCFFELEIYAVKEQQLLKLKIDIDDVNDNSPFFQSQSIVVNVSENALIGDFISLNKFLAVDHDIGENSAVTYSISPNPFFEIQQENDETAATVNLQLKVIQKLDHETKPTQTLTLTAKDNGKPPLSGSTELIVKINDVNDNDPVFEKEEYKAKLFENRFPGYVVVRVTAHDADSGQSGKIRYFVASQNKPLARRLLKIDSVTGDVILKKTLDREVISNLKVLVEARDSSLTNQRVGRAWLLISVEDVNDNAPTIDVNYIFTSDGDTVYIPENTEIGTNFAYVTAKDADLKENGKVVVFIESISTDRRSPHRLAPFQSVFNLTNVGFLSINGKLDREDTDRYEITLRSCDHGFPKKCSSKVVSIILLDVNDHQPILASSKLFFTLPEDTPLNTKVTTIQAVDRDAINPPSYYKNEDGAIAMSPYGTIFYHIINGDGTFQIDSHSGELILSRPLDREKKEKHEITVRAKDSGHGKALQSTCQVKIVVSDINDNKPRFTTPRFNNGTYYATTKKSHVIVKVQAVDYDQGENGSVSYFIISEDGNQISRDQLFIINNQSGELRMNMKNSKLNQSLGVHRVVVQARDGGVHPRYSTLAFQIVVTNSDTLPTTGVMNLKLNSPPSLVLIVISCSASVFVLTLIVSATVVACTNKKRKSRSYSCAMDDKEGLEWTFGARRRSRSFSDSRTIVSRGASFRSGNEVDRRYSSIVSGTPSNIDIKQTGLGTSKDDLSDTRYSPLKYLSFDKRYTPQNRHLARISSSHDGDSGRGDSDPDAAPSEITNENDFPKRTFTPENQLNQIFRHRNSQCTEQCLLYGHSDTCWMPNVTETEPSCCISSSLNTSIASPFFTSVPTAPLSARPASHFNHYANQPCSSAAGSIPYNHHSNYPANDLSAIYSDVIMNTRQQDVRYAPGRATPSIHPINDFRSPRNQYMQNFTPSSSLQQHEVLRTPQKNVNPKIPEPEDVKRYSSSLSTSFPIANGSRLNRSSSADFLNSLQPKSSKESETKAKDSVQRKQSMGEMSMMETQEIIDNIEKLLHT